MLYIDGVDEAIEMVDNKVFLIILQQSSLKGHSILDIIAIKTRFQFNGF